MAGDDENSTNPPPVPPTLKASHTLSTIKLPILKKGVSTEDANQKFHRFLPFSWSQVSLIMRTNLGVDTHSFDDLYNNLRVFESDVKGSTASSSCTQNVAFVSSDSTNSTNEVDHKDLEGVYWTGHAEDNIENYAFRSSNVEDSHVNDRFAKVKGMHAIGPPMTGIYMPPKFYFGMDESKFTYGPKQFKTSESDAKTSDLASCESNSSVETLESVSKPVEYKTKAVSEPKVWSDAPIIKDYESDSDDEYVCKASVEQETPSCAFINTVKHVKTPMHTVKDQDTCSQNPKVPKRDWTGLMSKRLGLGYGYTKKACFVCGSFSHLIRDCDFHEKRMAKQIELNKRKNK
nr:hypothetical protein [Tanacetum cinerariifolium]